MTKKKSAKRAFISSFMSFVMCFAMLAGTTFAWYTDSVTSSGNKIIAGTLDIQLWKYDGTEYVDISNNPAPIFQSANLVANNSTDTLWEPGKTQVAYLKLVNNGNLALKYTVALEVRNVAKDLYKVMKYEIVNDAKPAAPVTAWNSTNAISVTPGTQNTQAVNVPMDPKTDNVPVEHYFALVIHMDEEAGNEYMGGEVDFDLNVLATQYTKEYDSFNNLYDVNADATPDNARFFDFTTVAAPVTAGIETTIGNIETNGVEATISADAVENATSLSLIVSESEDSDAVITVSTGTDAQYIDVSLVDQDSNVVEQFENNGYADVKLDIGKDLIVTEVNHKSVTLTGEANAYGEYYSYNAVTGILTLHVTSFSPFSIGYEAAAAKVGTEVFPSFTEALNKAVENGGDTITMLRDSSFTLGSRYDIKNVEITVDLNGFILESSASNLLRPNTDCTFNLTDMSGSGRGAFVHAQSANVLSLQNNAVVNISNVSLSSAGQPLTASSSSELNLDNVTVTCGSNYSAALSVNGTSKLTAKDSTFVGGPAIQCNTTNEVVIDNCDLIGYYTSILTVQNSSSVKPMTVVDSRLTVREGAKLQTGLYIQSNCKNINIENSVIDMANSTHGTQYAIRITSEGVSNISADGLHIKNVTGYAICMDMDGFGTAAFTNSTFQTTEETVEMDHSGGSVTFNSGCVITTGEDSIYYTANGSMTTVNPGVTLNVNPGESNYKYTVNGNVTDNGNGTWTVA